MPRRFTLLPAILIAFFLAVSVAFATEYLAAASDLPLADGLKEQLDKGAVFDTPLGRIVTAYAAGNAKPQAVLDFYDDTLPQLGWERDKPGTYHRKKETLKIDVVGPEQGPCKVSYTLSSQNQ
ncbi:MAG TPA: hypothetical protein VHE77_16880 [Dongiaceae bacterium]|jgi:hypothetical protein|nr:hypothetical protein [Dongiaceae bacterium]